MNPIANCNGVKALLFPVPASALPEGAFFVIGDVRAAADGDNRQLRRDNCQSSGHNGPLVCNQPTLFLIFMRFVRLRSPPGHFKLIMKPKQP